MKKKILIGSIVTIVLLSMSFLVLTACNDKEPEPREVIIEVINPNTGEVLKENDHIDLPTEKTRVEVRVKDKQTGIYLTDEDLLKGTLKESCSIGFSDIDNDGHLGGPLYTSGYWPTEDDLRWNNYFEISVWFECETVEIENRYFRKYKLTEVYIKFYIK